MASKEDRRAALERELAELDNEPEDDGIEYVDISEGDKSVRFAGKGAVEKSKRWLKTNFGDLFDPEAEPEAEPEPGKTPKIAVVKDEPDSGKRAFGRRIG